MKDNLEIGEALLVRSTNYTGTLGLASSKPPMKQKAQADFVMDSSGREFGDFHQYSLK